MGMDENNTQKASVSSATVWYEMGVLSVYISPENKGPGQAGVWKALPLEECQGGSWRVMLRSRALRYWVGVGQQKH